jgi:hypothetical protein
VRSLFNFKFQFTFITVVMHRFVEDLSEDTLDEYLDFCESELLAPEGNKRNGQMPPPKRFCLLTLYSCGR